MNKKEKRELYDCFDAIIENILSIEANKIYTSATYRKVDGKMVKDYEYITAIDQAQDLAGIMQSMTADRLYDALELEE